ncbi:MAG: TM2 domain-containing protein [Lachnospiraceae bacterium]|nr:TM2 domain-containing protein [Lachnospiraceae bacterium]
MKCPNCGAEITGRFCAYCGSEAPSQPVNIVNNFYGESNLNQGNANRSIGCPNCGNNNVTFRREQNGLNGYRTVGMCNYFGNTWVTAQDQGIFSQGPAYNTYNYNNTYPYSRQADSNLSDKSRWIALILLLLLGVFGAHYFYAGRIGMGIVYMLTFGFWGIGYVVDIIRILLGVFKDANGRYMR